MSDELVERVARAIYIGKYGSRGGRWDLVETKDVWHDLARAALSALPGHELLREALEALDGIERNCQTIQPVGDNIAFSYMDPVNPSYIVGARHVASARATAEKIRAELGDK